MISLAITRRQRSILLFVSAASYAAWLSGAGDRLDAETSDPPFVATEPSATFPPSVTSIIRRDPFVGGPSVAAPESASDLEQNAAARDLSNAAATSSGGPYVPDIDVADSTLPSTSATAGPLPADGSTELKVRATIVGALSLAYVETPNGLTLVHRGDALGDSTVTAVDLRGITLADGTRLPLVRGDAPQPPPGKKPTLGDKIDALRTLIRTFISQSGRPVPSASAMTPGPPPSPEVATPGPLPTVVPYPLPVGVSPTSNAYGPTPFPVLENHPRP